MIIHPFSQEGQDIMRYCIIAATVLLALLGCGRGHEVKQPDLKEALTTFEEAVTEVRGGLRESQRASEVEDEDAARSERGESDDKLAIPVQAVVSAAETLVVFATGNPHESEAKAIQAEAQELAKKAQGKVTAAEIDRTIEQLLSKAVALKAKL
jgi:hypothetical protein